MLLWCGELPTCTWHVVISTGCFTNSTCATRAIWFHRCLLSLRGRLKGATVLSSGIWLWVLSSVCRSSTLCWLERTLCLELTSIILTLSGSICRLEIILFRLTLLSNLLLVAVEPTVIAALRILELIASRLSNSRLANLLVGLKLSCLQRRRHRRKRKIGIP